MRYLWWPIVLLVGTSDVAYSKGENYALTAHVAPLRLSQLDLVNLLNTTINVVKSANAGYRAPSFSDEHKRLRFSDAAPSIDLSDQVSLNTLRLAPPAAYKIAFEYRNDQAPISKVILRFVDYDRSITIEGTSINQIHALLRLIERELGNHTTLFGGPGFRILIAAVLWILGCIALWLIPWGATMLVATGLTMVVLATLTLMLGWFPGTAVYSRDASLFVRHESLISLVGVCLTTLLFVLQLIHAFFRRKVTTEQDKRRQRRQRTTHQRPRV